MKTAFFQPHSVKFARIKQASAISLLAVILSACDGGGSTGSVRFVINPAEPDVPTVIEANIDTLAARVGGATQDVKSYNDGSTTWTLYTMADRFAATPIATSKGSVHEISAPGYIQHITVVKAYGGKSYALLSMGGKGIGVVDISNPANMAYKHTMTVNYTPPAYTYSDGGGSILTSPAATTPLTSGPVNDLLVDDNGTPADTSDDQLYIANTAFGIQKTHLSNLMDATADGVLSIDGGARWTLKYAGEVPWGGPLSLTLHGGKLYAALGFIGIGIYDPATLSPLGNYNLYTDCSNSAQEDWFGYPKRKISCPDPSNSDLVVAPSVSGVAAVDSDGMPSYVQAAYELKNKTSLTWYPWAEFDRYGKYYYNARKVDVVDLPAGGGHPARSEAYIAYSLGGLVAVDVSTPSAPSYEGFIPAVPAHGPDEPPVNVENRGILSHSGSGMLKEAGVIDVQVVPNPADATKYRAYYSDHFAGLVVADGAEAPNTQWRNGGGMYNNDTNSKVFWPDYEFVTSYDMTPIPIGEESLPAFLVPDNAGNYPTPVTLATGEINGHGGPLFLTSGRNTSGRGQVDAVQSSGAGGVSFVDVVDLTSANVAVANRFGVPASFVSTDEIGAAVDGSATQSIAIGHTGGVTVEGDYLYVGDGPHGTSVWKIADGMTPIDDFHLVANTLQSETAIPGYDVLPTHHALKVGFNNDPNEAYVMCQSLGMAKLDTSAIVDGTATVGAPVLLNAYGNIFEHSTEDSGDVDSLKVTGQDHAYGVAFSGKYAIIADGDNGLTVYDTTADPSTGAHLIANIGDADGTKGKPPLGRATAVKLWTDSATGNTYAVVAAGSYGISVVDMTAFLASGQASDLGIDKLVKTFEPIKGEEDNLFGSADGKSVDVQIVDDIAYISYDSFGLVAYRMADLIRPATEERPTLVPSGQAADICSTITDVTKLTAKGGVGECRPTAIGHFKLQELPGYENVEGGALYMTAQYFPTQYRDANYQLITMFKPRLIFYVAYGDAGVVKIDWRDPANPTLLAIHEVVGEATATAIKNGRVYIAAGTGGLTVLK